MCSLPSDKCIVVLHPCSAAVKSAGLEIFLAEKVDVAILEVGLGGRLDATNCIPAPVVCGISSLGFDHMELLGYALSVSNFAA